MASKKRTLRMMPRKRRRKRSPRRLKKRPSLKKRLKPYRWSNKQSPSNNLQSTSTHIAIKISSGGADEKEG